MKKELLEELKMYFQFSVSILIAVAIGILSANKYALLLKSDLFHGILAIILFATTFIWILAWIYFDNKEIHIIEKHFNIIKLKRLNFLSVVLMLLNAIFLAALLAYSHEILIYTIILILNTLLTIVTTTIVHHHAIDEYVDIENIKKNNNEWRVVLEYYVKKPLYILDVFLLIMLFISIVLLISSLKKNFTNGTYISYFICIFSILVHELVVWRWRFCRDKKINNKSK